MFLSSLGLFGAGLHVPAAGPLQLGDFVAGGVARGAIMQAVIGNNPINQNPNPTLAAANAAIAGFDGNDQNFRTYQTIVTNISQAVNSQAAIDAVKAFENVIMYLYDYDVYLIGGYKPGVSIFFTGVRLSWVNPVSYFSLKSYFSDNNARSKQLIDELDKLADAVKGHSIVEYARIKATVHSYRHWRRNVMLSIAAYLAADMCKHGYEKSIVNQYWQGGFDNAGEITINHISNVGTGLYYVGKGVSKCAQGIWNVGCKVGNFAFHGKKAFKKNNEKQEVEQKGQQERSKKIVEHQKIVKQSQPIYEKISVDDKMSDFERARFDAVSESFNTIDQTDDGLNKNFNATDQSDKALKPLSRKESWNFVKSSIAQAVAFEVDAREKRKEIWNARCARMKNIWNEGPSTQDQDNVVKSFVDLSPVQV